jgi:hypothetical protein
MMRVPCLIFWVANRSWSLSPPSYILRDRYTQCATGASRPPAASTKSRCYITRWNQALLSSLVIQLMLFELHVHVVLSYSPDSEARQVVTPYTYPILHSKKPTCRSCISKCPSCATQRALYLRTVFAALETSFCSSAYASSNSFASSR